MYIRTNAPISVHMLTYEHTCIQAHTHTHAHTEILIAGKIYVWLCEVSKYSCGEVIKICPRDQQYLQYVASDMHSHCVNITSTAAEPDDS